jgi:hypothetical protein
VPQFVSSLGIGFLHASRPRLNKTWQDGNVRVDNVVSWNQILGREAGVGAGAW